MTRVIEELPGGVFGLEAERLIGKEEFGDGIGPAVATTWRCCSLSVPPPHDRRE